jgi:hypothetical protein
VELETADRTCWSSPRHGSIMLEKFSSTCFMSVFGTAHGPRTFLAIGLQLVGGTHGAGTEEKPHRDARRSMWSASSAASIVMHLFGLICRDQNGFEEKCGFEIFQNVIAFDDHRTIVDKDGHEPRGLMPMNQSE